MSLAPEPGIGRLRAAEQEPTTTMTGISTDGGATFIEFDLADVTDDEAIALEDAFGVTWLKFLEGLGNGSIRSQKQLVWLAKRRHDPAVGPDDVTYTLSQFQIRSDDTAPLPEGEDSAPAT